MTAPERSSEQRAQALEAAMAARHERARLRLALKDRTIKGSDVVAGAVDQPRGQRRGRGVDRTGGGRLDDPRG